MGVEGHGRAWMEGVRRARSGMEGAATWLGRSGEIPHLASRGSVCLPTAPPPFGSLQSYPSRRGRCRGVGARRARSPTRAQAAAASPATWHHGKCGEKGPREVWREERCRQLILHLRTDTKSRQHSEGGREDGPTRLAVGGFANAAAARVAAGRVHEHIHPWPAPPAVNWWRDCWLHCRFDARVKGVELVEGGGDWGEIGMSCECQ